MCWEVRIDDPHTISFIPSCPRGCAQFLLEGIIFAAKVNQLLLFSVDGVGQCGVVVGELSGVHHVLLECGAAVHGRKVHIFQVSRQ